MNRGLLATFVGVALATAGCGYAIDLRTDPKVEGPDAICPSLGFTGQLAVDASAGLVLVGDMGVVKKIEWPHGYGAGWEWNCAVLVDQSGIVVARQGEVVRVTGSPVVGAEDLLGVCGRIELLEST